MFFLINLMFKMCKNLNCINKRVSHYLEWNCFVAGIVATKDMKRSFGSDLDFCYHCPLFRLNPLLNERKLNLECCKILFSIEHLQVLILCRKMTITRK